jgi:hypothetical protein
MLEIYSNFRERILQFEKSYNIQNEEAFNVPKSEGTFKEAIKMSQLRIRHLRTSSVFPSTARQVDAKTEESWLEIKLMMATV